MRLLSKLFGERRPNVPALAKKGDVSGLLAALKYGHSKADTDAGVAILAAAAEALGDLQDNQASGPLREHLKGLEELQTALGRLKSMITSSEAAREKLQKSIDGIGYARVKLQTAFRKIQQHQEGLRPRTEDQSVSSRTRERLIAAVAMAWQLWAKRRGEAVVVPQADPAFWEHFDVPHLRMELRQQLVPLNDEERALVQALVGASDE